MITAQGVSDSLILSGIFLDGGWGWFVPILMLRWAAQGVVMKYRGVFSKQKYTVNAAVVAAMAYLSAAGQHGRGNPDGPGRM